MKYALILMFLAFQAAADESVVCKTKNFNAKTVEGQAFEVSVDKNGLVTRVRKLEGSWFCDNVESRAPRFLRESAKVRIYELNFGCDAWNERLVVPKYSKPRWVRYEFTYASDERYIRERDFLTCQ